MKRSNRPLQTFVRSIEGAIEKNKRNGEAFTLVRFDTAETIAAIERGKLVEWASMIVEGHCPAGSRVFAWPEACACLLLLPSSSAPEAETTAAGFTDQLNKLPVWGIAPGNAWSHEVLPYPGRAEALEALVRDLRSASARRGPALAVRGR